MIITLPDVLLHSVLSFCDYKDTLTAATLCRLLLDHVEAFSGDKLTKIRENHQVDSSWNYRLGMQVNRPRERQPATLSNRHMLKVARQTHLYSLGGRDCSRGVLRLLCLNEKTLISCGQDRLIRVWDLTTQCCVRAFRDNTHGANFMSGFEFAAGRIVSTSARCANIWTLGGTCLHTIDFGTASFGASASCGNNVFFSLIQAEDANTVLISVIDVPSGERIQEKSLEWNAVAVTYCVSAMTVMGEWLLVLVNADEGAEDEEDERDDEDLVGIHVLNRSDLTEASHFRGSFLDMKSSDDNHFIVATRDTGDISIFCVDDGTLINLRSFAREIRRGCLLVSRSLIYTVSCYERPAEEWHINVFDINSGERVKTMCFPSHDAFTGTAFYPWDLASNGQEVFCAFNIQVDERSMSTIKAYPA